MKARYGLIYTFNRRKFQIIPSEFNTFEIQDAQSEIKPLITNPNRVIEYRPIDTRTKILPQLLTTPHLPQIITKPCPHPHKKGRNDTYAGNESSRRCAGMKKESNVYPSRRLSPRCARVFFPPPRFRVRPSSCASYPSYMRGGRNKINRKSRMVCVPWRAARKNATRITTRYSARRGAREPYAPRWSLSRCTRGRLYDSHFSINISPRGAIKGSAGQAHAALFFSPSPARRWAFSLSLSLVFLRLLWLARAPARVSKFFH